MAADHRSQLGTGLALMTVGLLLFASRQHLIGPLHLSRLWPVILIVLGFGRFMAKTEDGKHRGGLWLIMIGGIFLLNNYHVLMLDQSWPLFIVALGLSLMFGRRNHGPEVGAKS